MATIILGAVGASLGASMGGSVLGLSAAVIGRAVGATVGRVIDQRLLGSGSELVETGRVDRLRVTGASEGAGVQQIYGRMRVAGQVIWSSRFLETKRTKKQGGGKGAPSTTVTSYNYSISLAVALCEGEISGIGRIWADGEEIAPNSVQMRLYKGTESQVPDSKIIAIEGWNDAPAYRGVAYVLFEDLALERFGNRVPQFTFEVLRPAQGAGPGEPAPLNEAVKAVALMPGSGEYTLATQTVYYDRGTGRERPANRNSPSGSTDFMTSMRALEAELPNCGSALMIVSWFGDDLRCNHTQIQPKVEQDQVDSTQMPWRAGGRTRLNSEVVPEIDGRPVYGGTPADAAVIQAIQDLKRRGKKVVFYPFILMEQLAGNSRPDPWSGGEGQPALPWRGRITSSRAPGVAGSPDRTAEAEAQVAAFFGTAEPGDFTAQSDYISYDGPEAWRYRRFILHYAHLCHLAGGVDAFCIGSEMRGLTQIRGAGDSFPAVAALRDLAADVRSILGSGTKISYAADWSEYFGYAPSGEPGSRYFHLDPLWADSNIDFIGIDNYMPLADWRDSPEHADAAWLSPYSIPYLQANIEGGEGFDWYYASEAGRAAQERLPISDGAYGEPWIWRYKDLRSWWSLPHYERVNGVRAASPTAWVPQSKPFWFTEYGCAAIDKGANQPNKFLDPKSSESAIPYFSNGTRDDLMQMAYIRAFQDYWEDPSHNPTSSLYGGRMIDMEKAHVWAWDARPYPYFPGLSSVWSDAGNYLTGHWLNGRTAGRDLAEVVREICARSGVTEIDVSRLWGYVRGYGISEIDSGRSGLQPLMLAHGFDAYERDGLLAFRTRSGRVDARITLDQLAEHPEQEGDLLVTRAPEIDATGRVQITHLAADGSYEARSTEARLPDPSEQNVSRSDLNMSLTFGEGNRLAERWLSEARVGLDTVRFALPPSFAYLTAGDVVEIAEAPGPALYRIDRIEDFGLLLVEAVRIEPGIYIPGGGFDEGDPLAVPPPPARPFAAFLDLPLLTGTEVAHAPYLAAVADPWPGELALFSSPSQSNFGLNIRVDAPATLGVTVNSMARADPGRIDRGPALEVDLSAGSLSSVDRLALLNGANLLAIGDGQGADWELFQCERAELIAEDRVALSLRLRGQGGTEAVMPDLWPSGSLVVLVDETLLQIDLPLAAKGLERNYRIGPSDEALDSDSYIALSHTAEAIGLRPYAPVHLRAEIFANGTHEVTWIRQTRIGGDDWSLEEVPLSEARERYDVTVRQGGVIRRQKRVEDPRFAYPESQRIADGVSGAYEVEISQVSDAFGPGPGRRIAINV